MNETRRSSITISSGILVRNPSFYEDATLTNLQIYKPRAGMGAMLGAASMESAARGLAADLAPIRANSIVLGAIRTPLLEKGFGGNAEAEKMYANATLLKTIGEAEEAAEAYLYCMRCAYVTGSRIDCEGGALLC